MTKLHAIAEHIKGTPKAGRHWKMPVPTPRVSAEPIFTPCPPFPADQRFAVKPEEAAAVGFAAAGLGINPLTGRPW